MRHVRWLSWLLVVPLVGSCGKGPADSPNLSEMDEAETLARDALMLEDHQLAECGNGIQAFSETVHPLVTANCAGCHDRREGTQNGPRFAVQDLRESYAMISRYVNFDDVESSLFFSKGGNQHCSSYGINCGVDFALVKEKLSLWWTGGENLCVRRGKYQTPSFSVPIDMPGKDEGFKALRWDLSPIRDDLQGAFFEMQAQIFAAPSEATKGAYRFRAPRLLIAGGNYAVGNVRVSVNGKQDPLANGYASLNKVVRGQALPDDAGKPSTHPTLSSKSLIVVMDKAEGDQLGVSFEVLDPAMPRQCKDQAKFVGEVLPVLEARNCYTCHGGGPDRLPGRSPAKERFGMDAPAAELCSRFLERVDFDTVMNSVVIDYSFRGMNDHPRIIPRIDEIQPAWTNWIRSEAAKAPVTYETVKGIFQANCEGCHSDQLPRGRLKLNEFPFRSDRLGTDQTVIVREILLRMQADQNSMPPGGKRPNDEVAKIQQWMNDGLPER